MLIYRPGAITAEHIRAVAGAVEIFKDRAALVDEAIEALPSPGVGLRHYAPRARLILVDAPIDDLPQQLADVAALYPQERVGIMLPEDVRAAGIGETVFKWGRWNAPEEMARLLYAGLRTLDSEGCTMILCPVPPGDGIGAAILDRLRKAARQA